MRITKKMIALAAAVALLLSMVTVASAAETKTFSLDGTDLFSVTNIYNSYLESYEEEGISYHDEVLECTAPVTVTVLNGNHEDFEVMDNTYEIMNQNERDTGFIMPDGCPGEKEYWEGEGYSGRVAEGTTYTLTEPGTYGVNMWLGGDTYYYVAILIDGERTREGDNFTKAYYQQRQENAVSGSVPQSDASLNTNLVNITNLIKQNGFLEVQDQNTGEIAPLPVYSCLAPAEITAANQLEGFMLHRLVINDGPYFPSGSYYLADNESQEEFDLRYENGTPAGTKYTVTDQSEMFYLYASDGTESIHAVIRLDGAAPININNGTTSETVLFWDEIPNGSVTINGVYDITYEGEGVPVYVIDRNSTITYNSYLSTWINVGSDDIAIGEDPALLTSPICTPVVYETISYTDNVSWYDSDSDMETKEQVAPGMTVQFNAVGRHHIQVTPGYASREERISIQDNENTNYGWQWSPTISVWVIDPAPWADYTASKVIVDGVETEFEAYNIHDNNYFKLRDIAMAINGSEKQFGVYWDGEKNAISLISGMRYNPVGGELAKGDGASKAAAMTTSIVYADEKPISLSAYNINDNNYFKLRDLGETFDFDVTWDGTNNCIVIDTASSYTAD